MGLDAVARKRMGASFKESEEDNAKELQPEGVNMTVIGTATGYVLSDWLLARFRILHTSNQSSPNTFID